MDWDWIEETALEIGGTFTFARGASPEQVMTAFGMNPARAHLVPASDAAQALHDTDWLRTYPPEHPWIRVGVAGEWGFALDESSAGSGGYEHAAVAALAASPEVVLFTHTQTIDDFAYWADGTLVTMFEPGGLERYGTEPDRFAEQMRQVGLPTAIGDDRAENPVIALLQMLTVALGIWVPRDLALGPLLTVQRETALPRTRRADAPPAPLVSSAHLRPLVQRLLDSGVTAQAIAVQAGPALSTNAINILLSEANFWVPATIAERYSPSTCHPARHPAGLLMARRARCPVSAIKLKTTGPQTPIDRNKGIRSSSDHPCSRLRLRQPDQPGARVHNPTCHVVVDVHHPRGRVDRLTGRSADPDREKRRADSKPCGL